MSPKNKQSSDYLEDQQEWQQNQYNPGHYTGGKIPPFLHKPGNRKALGLLLIGIAIFQIILLFLSTSEQEASLAALELILRGSIILITFIAGIVVLRRK